MSKKTADTTYFSPYIPFSREEWAKLRFMTLPSLNEGDITKLQGINDRISMDEVTNVYLPLSRLLNLYTTASQNLYSATNAFLNKQTQKVPYIIGIAGSVAVGKSTTARIIQELLSRWPNHPKVDLISTDGFLYPNVLLEKKGIMNRKGFPESYDIRRLIRFLADIKSGCSEVVSPIYSHEVYDILPNEVQKIRQPDILIVEGINVLQVQKKPDTNQLPQIFVSDFFDFSIYVDANEKDIIRWYIERFKVLRNTSFQSPTSYFHQYAALSDEEAEGRAQRIWNEINGVNLKLNILPTRYRADLILEKGPDHFVSNIRLRKI